jgi:YVTN family beta-propeller protein
MVRFDPVTGVAQAINNGRQSYGMGIDSSGKVWVSNWDYDSIQRFSSNGTLEATFTPAGMNNPRGVAVTLSDDNIWVANSNANTVSRLNSAGVLVATIPVGSQPTGVAVDSNGKVWVTNFSSNSVMRIDPATNTVDLTIDLGPGAQPYNYSDMTGSVLFGTTIDEGTWRDLVDSGTVGTTWDNIFWNTEAEGSIPAGTSLIVEARVSDDLINWSPYVAYSSGAALGLTGRYLEARATFGRDVNVNDTPVLSDLSFHFTPLQSPGVVPAPSGFITWAGLVVCLMGLRFVPRRRTR